MSKSINNWHSAQQFRRSMCGYLESCGVVIDWLKDPTNKELMITCEMNLGLPIRPTMKKKARVKSILEAMPDGIQPKKDATKTERKDARAAKRRRNKNFYATAEWRKARYQALAANNGRCELCGAGKHQGVVLHVDHIKPRSKCPHLELDPSNLQVLCEDCNMGKSNLDSTDWREPDLRVIMGEKIA